MKKTQIFVNLSDITCVQFKYLVYFYDNDKVVDIKYARDHQEAEKIAHIGV